MSPDGGSEVRQSRDNVICFFFFTSRRRHTRLRRDWSSDVCSSDLRMPTHGLAHFVAAQAAYHRADPRAAQSHLEKSVAFAGFEGWLAERRLALVVYRMPGDSLQASTTIKSDIATLLTTQSGRSEEHTSELQSRRNLVCRLLLEKKTQHTVYSPFLPPSTYFHLIPSLA